MKAATLDHTDMDDEGRQKAAPVGGWHTVTAMEHPWYARTSPSTVRSRSSRRSFVSPRARRASPGFTNSSTWLRSFYAVLAQLL